MAKVIKEFRGCRDGERVVRLFREGDEVQGELARIAVGEGWATDASTSQVRRTTAHDGAPQKRKYTRRKKSFNDN